MQFGQFALHQEKEVYRLVITTGASTVHPVLGTFGQKGCVPAAYVLKNGGTISTFTTGGQDGKTVLGVGTSFITDVDPGDYLTDTNGIVRKVIDVRSDTELTIEAKFPSDLTTYTATIIKKRSFLSALEAKSTGSAASMLQEQTFISADTFFGGGAPVSYDASGANAQISFTLHI